MLFRSPMKRGAWVSNDALAAESIRLVQEYQVLAQELNIPFVDTSDWNIELTFDGVHYSEKGHQTFAEQLFLSLSRSLEVNT